MPKALLEFQFTVRDKEHFYQVIRWLNANIGHGNRNWSMTNKTLKGLIEEKKPKTAGIKIHVAGFSEQEIKVILTLL